LHILQPSRALTLLVEWILHWRGTWAGPQ